MEIKPKLAAYTDTPTEYSSTTLLTVDWVPGATIAWYHKGIKNYRLVSVAFHARVLAGVYRAEKFVIVLRQYIVSMRVLNVCALKRAR